MTDPTSVSDITQSSRATSWISWVWPCAIAAALITSQIILARASQYITHIEVHQWTPALVLMALLIIPAVILFAAVPSLATRPSSHILIIGIIATGIAMRVSHFGATPIAETDHFRYLWDGAVLANGFNPYRVAPDTAINTALAPHLASLAVAGKSVLANINFPDYRSIYPGTAQLLFAAAYLLTPWSVDGLRLIFLCADVAAIVFLLSILRELNLSPVWAAAYWLNPLVVLVTANQVHIDAAIPPLLLASLWCINREKPAAAALALGFAAGVKIWPLLLVPLLMRRLWPNKRATIILLITGTATTLAVMGPLVTSSLTAGSGLTAYAGGWAMNNPVYLWITWALWAYLPASIPSDQILRATLALLVIGTALHLAKRSVHSLHELLLRATTTVATLFYLSPTEFPWYALWFLPIAAAIACRPLLLAPVLLPTYFAFFPMAESGIRHWYHYGLAFAHWLPVIAWLWWLRSKRQLT